MQQLFELLIPCRIVVNNSMKIEVVRLEDFAGTGLIQASYPRYFYAMPVRGRDIYKRSLPG
ncbi:MAG: hypothetical protein U0T82_17215 [Bacteroidales bacterium]